MSENKNVVVVNTRASAVEMSSPTFRLIPGENDVPVEVLEQNLENRNGVVKGWFDPDIGFLSIKAGAKKAKPLTADLSKVNVGRAAEIIEGTLDLSTLRKWARAENRSTVNRALKKRIDELETPSNRDTETGSTED